MAFTDYTREPETGLYNFRGDDGRELAAYGPEAENLARFVDESKAARPLLAQNDPASMARELVGGPAPPPSIAADFTRPQPGAPPPSPQQVWGQVAGMQPPASPLEEMMTPEARAARIYAPVRVGGRAAFDPVAADASRTAVRTGQTTQVSGATPETPQEELERLQSEKKRRELFDTRMAETKAASEAAEAMHKRNAEEARSAEFQTYLARQDAEIRERQIREEGDRRWARLDADRRAASNLKVDPKRLFKTGQMTEVGNAIAMAFGAFGAALTGTRNFAQDFIENAIKNDIDAQVDEVRTKGESAENAVANFMRFHGLSLEEATSAVERTQREYAGAVAARQAAEVGTLEARLKGAELMQSLKEKNDQTELDFRQKVRGQITTSTQAQFMSPQAASAGYTRAPTAEEVLKRAQGETAVSKAIGASEEPEERRARAEEHRVKREGDQRTTEYGEKRRAIRGTEETARQYAEAMGATIKPDGTVTMPEGDIPGTGITGKTWTIGLTKEGRNVRMTREDFIASVLQAQSGMGVSDTERERTADRMRGLWDEDAVKGLEYGMQKMRDLNRKLDASYGVDVVQQYEQQESETQRHGAERERGAVTGAEVY